MSDRKYIAKWAFCLNCFSEVEDIEQKVGKTIDGSLCPICQTSNLINKMRMLQIIIDEESGEIPMCP